LSFVSVSSEKNNSNLVSFTSLRKITHPLEVLSMTFVVFPTLRHFLSHREGFCLVYKLI